MFASRPSMTRRNARKRGPLESHKYISDVYERRYDLSSLYNKSSTVRKELTNEIDRLERELKENSYLLDMIEKKLNSITIKEVV